MARLRPGRHRDDKLGPPVTDDSSLFGQGVDVLLFSHLFTANGWCSSSISSDLGHARYFFFSVFGQLLTSRVKDQPHIVVRFFFFVSSHCLLKSVFASCWSVTAEKPWERHSEDNSWRRTHVAIAAHVSRPIISSYACNVCCKLESRTKKRKRFT